MESVQVYGKNICMSELHAQRSVFRNSHYYDAASGLPNDSLVYIVKGSAEFNAVTKRLRMEAGTFFFLPAGIRYNSVWHGDPDIEFYSLHIIPRKSGSVPPDRYALQTVDALSLPSTEAVFREIFERMAAGDRISQIRAVGLYYSFWAEVLPHLREEAPLRMNPALLAAVQYIEAHYACEFGMDELARQCCVSQSRLHHLFKSELHTTPVKYRNEMRIERAAASLRGSTLSIEDIAAVHGFHSAAYFREIFREYTGMSPSEYRSMVGQPKKEPMSFHCI